MRFAIVEMAGMFQNMNIWRHDAPDPNNAENGDDSTFAFFRKFDQFLEHELASSPSAGPQAQPSQTQLQIRSIDGDECDMYNFDGNDTSDDGKPNAPNRNNQQTLNRRSGHSAQVNEANAGKKSNGLTKELHKSNGGIKIGGQARMGMSDRIDNIDVGCKRHKDEQNETITKLEKEIDTFGLKLRKSQVSRLEELSVLQEKNKELKDNLTIITNENKDLRSKLFEQENIVNVLLQEKELMLKKYSNYEKHKSIYYYNWN